MKMTDTNKTKGKKKGMVLAESGEIPRRLREYYDTIREQPLPDRFLDLLEKLEQAERAQHVRDGTDAADKGQE